MPATIRNEGPVKRPLLGLLAGGLVLAGLGSPMLLIFPMWIAVYLFRDRLAGLAARVPRDYGFLVAVVGFGMLTETFAIVQNLSRPASERILLDPEPAKDLVFALVYYSAVGVTWLALLRWRAYSRLDVFVVTGVFGIVVEQLGAVLVSILTAPLLGALYAVFVAFVYGLFPMLGLMVAGDGFEPTRPAPTWRSRGLALAALFGQFLLVGLVIYSPMRAVLR